MATELQSSLVMKEIDRLSTDGISNCGFYSYINGRQITNVRLLNTGVSA